MSLVSLIVSPSVSCFPFLHINAPVLVGPEFGGLSNPKSGGPGGSSSVISTACDGNHDLVFYTLSGAVESTAAPSEFSVCPVMTKEAIPECSVCHVRTSDTGQMISTC